jgi:hypothetical protein
MLKKIAAAASAAALMTGLMASGANASVRPSTAVPIVASTSTAVQVHDDDGHNDIFWIIGAGVIVGAILFILVFDDDDDDLPLSLA